MVDSTKSELCHTHIEVRRGESKLTMKRDGERRYWDVVADHDGLGHGAKAGKASCFVGKVYGTTSWGYLDCILRDGVANELGSLQFLTCTTYLEIH